MKELTQHRLVEQCWRRGFTVKRLTQWLNRRYGSAVDTAGVWTILRCLRNKKSHPKVA